MSERERERETYPTTFLYRYLETVLVIGDAVPGHSSLWGAFDTCRLQELDSEGHWKNGIRTRSPCTVAAIKSAVDKDITFIIS